MKIKKPANASGGAAIAGRLQLPTAAAAPTGPSAGKHGLGWAGGAAFVALVVSGVLVYMLWQHFEFLRFA